MSAENIIKRIIDDDRAECLAIEKDAKTRAAELLDSARQQAEARVAALDKKTDEECGELLRRRLQITELEGRKHELATRRALLDEAYGEALRLLVSMPDGEWQALIEKMVLKSAETGGEVVLAVAADAKRFEALLPRLNEALLKTGRQGGLTMSDRHADFAGGFALLGDGVELNCSFEVLLREMQETSEREIADMLFVAGV